MAGQSVKGYAGGIPQVFLCVLYGGGLSGWEDTLATGLPHLDSTGEEMWINKTIYLTKDNIQGDIIGIVSLRNVTDRYRQDYLRESLEKQASLDLLTGLYNHVTGEVLIKSKINNEKYVDAAFIIFDIDSFKKINDTHGHYFGDCVLQKVSDCLKGCIREDQDIAALIRRG